MENKSLKEQLDETLLRWGATEEVVVPVYGKVGQVPNGLLEDLETLANAHAMRVLDEFRGYCFEKHKIYSDTFLLQLESYIKQFKTKLQEENKTNTDKEVG